MRFYICEHEKSPCIFTEKTWQRLWLRNGKEIGGGDLARCIRHGRLISTVKEFPTKEDARKWAKPEVNF